MVLLHYSLLEAKLLMVTREHLEREIMNIGMIRYE